MYCINIMALTFLCLFVSLSVSVSPSVSGLKQLENCEAAGIRSCEQFRTDAASTRPYCQAIRLLHLLNKITDLLPLLGQIHPCKPPLYPRTPRHYGNWFYYYYYFFYYKSNVASCTLPSHDQTCLQ